MLILIAGITGNVGRHAAEWALSRGHHVRGLGRSPKKLPESISSSAGFELFVASSNYYDIAALDKACSSPSSLVPKSAVVSSREGGAQAQAQARTEESSGYGIENDTGKSDVKVEAVICAYAGLPELHLEGQLLLLRAAERAGIKRFMAASWNYDWRRIEFGEEPVYDPAKAFHRQVELTSSIKPLHIFSGMLAEVFFGVDGQDGFTPRDRGVWDSEHRSMDTWGTGDGEWNFTTEKDAGRWAVEAVVADGAEAGGYISLCSWTMSLRDIAKIYQEVRGVDVNFNYKGSLDELEALAVAEKNQSGYRNIWDWHRLWFMLFSLKGTWNLSDLRNEMYPNVQATSLKAFLSEHPEI